MSLSKHHSSMINSLRNLGRHDMIRRYFGGGYNEAILIDKYKVEFQENNNDSRLFIWTKDRPCIIAVISKADESAVIDSIEYNPDCTIDTMKKGEGTREMVNFTLDLLKKNGAKIVSLTDKSSIKCGTTDTRLGPMYFLKHGVTWYERYFGFKPEEKYSSKYQLMKKRREEMLDIDVLQSQPCEFFTNETIDEIFEYIGFVFFFTMNWVKKLD